MAAWKFLDDVDLTIPTILEAFFGTRMFFRARSTTAGLTAIDIFVRAPLVTVYVANVSTIQVHPTFFWAFFLCYVSTAMQLNLMSASRKFLEKYTNLNSWSKKANLQSEIPWSFVWYSTLLLDPWSIILVENGCKEESWLLGSNKDGNPRSTSWDTDGQLDKSADRLRDIFVSRDLDQQHDRSLDKYVHKALQSYI